MKFKTLRTSETGKKIQSIVDQIKACRKAILEFCDEYGIEKVYGNSFFAYGGVSGFKLAEDTKIDLKDTKKFPHAIGCVSPRLSTKGGKALQEVIKKLPKVDKGEYNNAFGYTDIWSSPGLNYSHDEYFLFTVGEKWGYEPPSDCIEITVKEYKELLDQVPQN